VVSSVSGKQTGSGSGVMSAVQSVFSSVGVAVFGTAFFTYALVGQAVQGFHTALLIQLGISVLFLAITPAFPKHAER
jgi:hypothetical protein